MNGLFITFEGTEGSGKSTQILKTAERLRERCPDLLLLREPGGTRIGEAVRDILKSTANNGMNARTELLLMNASRAQLVAETIRPALAKGRIVLCDRFIDSTVAYQVFGRELDASAVQSIIQFATGGLLPDLTLLLSVPQSVSYARRHSRSTESGVAADRFEVESDAFFERVDKGYAAIARTEGARIRVVDASETMDSVQESVWGALWPIVQQRFPGIDNHR